MGILRGTLTMEDQLLETLKFVPPPVIKSGQTLSMDGDTYMVLDSETQEVLQVGKIE